MSEEDDKGFKVRDRRRFTESGEPRDVEEPEAPAAAPSEPPEGAARRSSGARSVDFASLVLSVATNALVSLRGESETEPHIPSKVDLAAAAQNIDILAMLEEKTKGNLSAEEEALIQSVLYDLRMAYIQVAQGQPGA